MSTPHPRELIPHQYEMCLLERVLHWDEQLIRLATDTHRSLSHPLRNEGRLRSLHLCEYGAQAMAVHGALKARANGAMSPPGMLVSLRAVNFARDYIEDLPGELIIEARCLQASASTLQYQFLVTHRDELLAEGRAAVMLGTLQSPS
jgi:predicted hotdog family 3-hydroxylacyl-ACP dehydratase